MTFLTQRLSRSTGWLEMANKAMAEVVPLCKKPGTKVVTICQAGDALINKAVSGVYNKGKLEKGVAFPTCISVNHVVGHYSPLEDEDNTVLQEGDVVKIDLGVHIDGYIATVAHTVICTESTEPITGPKADVIMAAHQASECAQRMLKAGATNDAITDAIQKIADAYKVVPVEGVLSHQVKRHVIDGNRCIMNKSTIEHKVDDVEFEVNDVFAIDVVMSTGEGKPKQQEERTTVYKRALEQNYMLKMKASRAFYSEVNSKFSTMPFTLRAFEDVTKARLGVVECYKHELLHAYPVLHEKSGSFSAQCKFTALVMPSGTTRITAPTADSMPAVQSEYTIEDEEIKATLSQSTNKKKNKKKKKSGKSADAEE